MESLTLVNLGSAERIMLANQNSRRLHHNVSPFSYDVSLAQSAQDWCDTLAREDAFYHHDQSSKAFKDRYVKHAKIVYRIIIFSIDDSLFRLQEHCTRTGKDRQS